MLLAAKEDFRQLTDQIVASYNSDPATRHIDADALPNRETIIEVLHLLRELLFPGYFGKQNLASRTIKYRVEELLQTIHPKLLQQIRGAIEHENDRLTLLQDSATDSSDPSPTQPRANSPEQIVREFLGLIPSIRARLSTDVHAAFEGDPAAADTDEIIFSYPGFLAITIHRLAHELYLLDVPVIPRIMAEYAHSVTGIDIHAGASIGEYFFIDHGTGVVIGETTIIGDHVKIYQGVTLGALSTRGGQRLRGAKRHPTIDDHVVIYSGASILGGNTVVGEGAVIASNVFITQSVPPHMRVTVKNPDLRYRNERPQEFEQDLPPDWVI